MTPPSERHKKDDSVKKPLPSISPPISSMSPILTRSPLEYTLRPPPERETTEDPRVKFYNDRERVFAGFQPLEADYIGAFEDVFSIADLVRLFPTLKTIRLVDPSYKRESPEACKPEYIDSWIENPKVRPEAVDEGLYDRPFRITERLTQPDVLLRGEPYRLKVRSFMRSDLEIELIPLDYRYYSPPVPADLTFIKDTDLGERGLWPKVVSNVREGGFVLVTSTRVNSPRQIQEQQPPERLQAELPLVHTFNTSNPTLRTHHYFHNWTDLYAYQKRRQPSTPM